MQKGFTLIELIVVIAVIAVLYGIIMFSVSLYMNRSKDSTISASLSILIDAGEIYYTGNADSYDGFCDEDNSIISNVKSQLPSGAELNCSVNALGKAWVACVKEFTNPANVYCVDNRGMKEEVQNNNCSSIVSDFQCP